MSIGRVEIDADTVGHGSLKIDGIDLSNYISSFVIHCGVGELTRVELTLRPMLAEFRGNAALELIRTMLVEHDRCICTEVLPELGHRGGLEVDPDCPQHGKNTHPY